jgi:hypothetical protein
MMQTITETEIIQAYVQEKYALSELVFWSTVLLLAYQNPGALVYQTLDSNINEDRSENILLEIRALYNKKFAQCASHYDNSR